jgi:AraC-like DNA-binding protein
MRGAPPHNSDGYSISVLGNAYALVTSIHATFLRSFSALSHVMPNRTFVEYLDLDATGTRDLREGWTELFARALVPFDGRPDLTSGEPFRAQALRQRIGDLALVAFESGRGTARRDKREIAATDGDPLGITVFRRGRAVSTIGQNSAGLIPGTVAFWDGARPGNFTSLSPTAQTTLIIPRDRLRGAMPNYEAALGRLNPANAAVRLLVVYLGSLVRLAPELDEAARLAVSDATVELVRVALGASDQSPTLRSVMLAEARRHIEQHLSDPNLGPDRIARALSISVRTLHAVFEASGQSVTTTIRRRRLARCYADLANTGHDQVVTIALRWGFRSASHFTRAFRAEFGVSPREVRPERPRPMDRGFAR